MKLQKDESLKVPVVDASKLRKNVAVDEGRFATEGEESRLTDILDDTSKDNKQKG